MEIKVLKNILSANEQMAAENRHLLDSHKITAINIMASPGAGKTSFILETIRRLKSKVRIGVIEGDISSSIDAETIAREGVPVIQINTGGECHLEAGMIANALRQMPLQDIDMLFIENIGNLICPADFLLGEHKKVLVASTPEGADKPYKYPLMFNKADAIIINKVDLLPYLKFDMAAFHKAVRTVNDNAPIFPVSCTTGEGLDTWLAWLAAQTK
jgi:hydrogenase nickel incorporation protein HypB